MICPFCQFDLDVETLECPRCHAAYPQPAKPFGFRVRTMVAVGSMMMVMTFLLVDCVMSYLPGWPNSTISTASPQMRQQPYPDLKSVEVNQLLYDWQTGHQAVHTAEPNVHK
jgi:hypothetical protein